MGETEAAEQALLKGPGSGFALYGIALTSEKSGNADAAGKGYPEFVAAGKDAEPALDRVTHADR